MSGKASPAGWADSSQLTLQVKQGPLLSLSNCHTRIRLGEGHRAFKAPSGCSVPVLFLGVQADPRSLELQHKHTHAHTNLHPIKCSYRENPFQYFLVVGWLVGWLEVFSVKQSVLRITYNILILISTLEKTDFDLNFFSICFYSISTSWEILPEK